MSGIKGFIVAAAMLAAVSVSSYTWGHRSIAEPVCGPDRCQSATQACENVKTHAAGVEIPHDKELAIEFVEAACGY